MTPAPRSKGVRTARDDSVATYEANEHFFPRVSRDQVYVVSYPRSGNTWLRAMLTSLVHDRPVTHELVLETVPDVYHARAAGLHELPPRRYPTMIKSHSPYVDVPARVVYLIRDGRDATLSYYFYSRKIEKHNAEHPIHSVKPRDFFFQEDRWLGAWHEHVLGWLEGLADWSSGRYLITRYEDLLASPVAELRRVAEFIGLEAEDGRAARAVAWNERTTLARLDAQHGNGAFGYPGLTQSDWGSALTDEDRARYEELAGEALARAGYGMREGSEAAA